MFTTRCFALCRTMFFGFGKSTLLLPEAITTIETALHTISELAKFVSEDGVQAIRRMNLFPTINRILPLIRHDTATVPIEMHLRKTSGSSHLENTPITFHSYVMRGAWGGIRWCFGKSMQHNKTRFNLFGEKFGRPPKKLYY